MLGVCECWLVEGVLGYCLYGEVFGCRVGEVLCVWLFLWGVCWECEDGDSDDEGDECEGDDVFFCDVHMFLLV